MADFRCTVCNYIFHEETDGEFDSLPDDWRCPVCNAPRTAFVRVSATLEEGDRTVSEVFISQLAAWGVKYVFGIPGTSTLGLVDALRRNDEIRYIQVRHEAAAAFMASSYGKLTGQPAVCMAVAGPGASNLITGLLDAALDRAPVLAVTGQVETYRIGTGASQEIDQHSLFESFSVYNMTLVSPEEAAEIAREAVKHAILERGVSHVDVPRDVQTMECTAPVKPLRGMMAEAAVTPPRNRLRAAADLINRAERPVVIAGFGALEAADSVVELAERIGAAIVSTFRGKGIVDNDHPLYMGCHGSLGSAAAAHAVRKSDLLLVIGSSFSDLTQIPPGRTLQVDLDPMMVSRRHPVEQGLTGRSSLIVPELVSMVEKKERESYLAELGELRDEWLGLLESEADPSLRPTRPQYIISVLNRELDDDAIITLDVGENGWWFGRNFQMKSTQRLLFSGYLGSMGFGLPAAIAAQFEFPDRQVVCISGDGGFSMVMAEFLTAVKYGLPVRVFIMNNRNLAMIMQEQRVEGFPVWQTELQDCDFAGFAENCGGRGLRVDDPGELEESVREALGTDGPVLVDIETDPRRFI
ncbi:pyruvate oxidase/acetolactate synthase-1/2/3 large subunit [Methanothermobacter defluvii]|uniref:Pyruvate oxidase/acetolactate synthase-1/2/3 large subunit n=1 Tax=Methanothermobacter defluvii TaxID=49339 RepID=A0A371NFV3_9EURY|nr:thiamine pyrophosphate-dependent enzyme [Methanothermobacter defluvii]REE28858.1 pyruvate oxidase/acetolactate synthase-1/2/3 large subunit [Methanothermobacter defluvii]